MNNLNLSDPMLMDIAVPANLACGNAKGPRIKFISARGELNPRLPN